MADLGQPSSHLALEAGAPVYSCDGEEMGKVDQVLSDEGEEIFERGVLLKIDAAAAEELPAPR